MCFSHHGLAMDASSAAAASMFSVWACNVGACSVGIRTSVCGSGTWCCGSSSLLVEADACVANFAATISKFRDLEKHCYLLDAMLMAPRTLCQFPITVAMAAPVSHGCSFQHWRIQLTLGPIRERRELLLQSLHLRRNCTTEVPEFLEVFQLRAFLLNACCESRLVTRSPHPAVGRERTRRVRHDEWRLMQFRSVGSRGLLKCLIDSASFA